MQPIDSVAFCRQVGERLRLFRNQRGITQAELAKEIGIERATYANFELGRHRMQAEVLWRAAHSLAVPISALVPDVAVPPFRTYGIYHETESTCAIPFTLPEDGG